MRTISTSALSKKLGVESKILFEKLVQLNLIYRKDDKWKLTEKGKAAGGVLVTNETYGDFIGWPDNFDPRLEQEPTNAKENLNATKIGEVFGVSNQRVNNILSELGWIEEAVKGWQITRQGQQLGGIQKEHASGASFVIWPSTILKNTILLRSFKPNDFFPQPAEVNIKTPTTNQSIEPKYPETLLKAKDGHLVRSRAELIIDNLLYDYGLMHAYERELTVAETVLSDFYIPARNGGKAVYIEFWGISNNEKYLERKKVKQQIYRDNNLNLIELDDKHLDNIDSVLRKALLKFNINVE